MVIFSELYFIVVSGLVVYRFVLLAVKSW